MLYHGRTLSYNAFRPYSIVNNYNLDFSSSVVRRWGGYASNPDTGKCYRQERTAILLSLFLGVFGVDQFYAHHWALGVFKLLTGGGFGIWAMIDTILWIVGGIYHTPGCSGGSDDWRY